MQDAVHELLAAVRRLAVHGRQGHQLFRTSRQDDVACISGSNSHTQVEQDNAFMGLSWSQEPAIRT